MTRKNIALVARIAIIAMLLMSFPGTVLADGGKDGTSATANGYHVTLVFAEPATTGANEFHVQITDSMGMPVSNAEVEVTAMPVEGTSAHAEEPVEEMHGMDMVTATPAAQGMEDMPGMEMSPETTSNETNMDSHGETEEDTHAEEPMQVSLESGREAGEYSGEIQLNSPGDWIFNIHFTIDDRMTEVEIPIEVARTISNINILGGFFGINATVIAAAAFMKRKPISK